MYEKKGHVTSTYIFCLLSAACSNEESDENINDINVEWGVVKDEVIEKQEELGNDSYIYDELRYDYNDAFLITFEDVENEEIFNQGIYNIEYFFDVHNWDVIQTEPAGPPPIRADEPALSSVTYELDFLKDIEENTSIDEEALVQEENEFIENMVNEFGSPNTTEQSWLEWESNHSYIIYKPLFEENDAPGTLNFYEIESYKDKSTYGEKEIEELKRHKTDVNQDFVLTQIHDDGNDKEVTINVSDHEEKGLILYFWGTSCYECQVSFRELQSENLEGIEIIMINMYSSREDIVEFFEDIDLENTYIDFPVLYDTATIGEDSELMRHFNVRHSPRTIFINPRGEIAAIVDTTAVRAGDFLDRVMEAIRPEN